jgi:ribonuclease HII
MAVGAVVLDSSATNLARATLAKDIVLADSKKLTKQQREKTARWIKANAVAIGLGWVSNGEIDKLGLGQALKLAARRAVEQIPPEILEQLDQIIIDGTIKLIDDPRATTLAKADSKIAAVSAAAIVAKVARDAYMAQLDQVFPGYNFAKHVGYGTKLHRDSLGALGISPLHRQSFAPIAKMIDPAFARVALARKIDKTTGRIAENVAVKYLIQAGHQIIAQNWRTKFCEIDIVSHRDDTIYFTEVKYRKSARHGDGLAAITPKKLAQMRRAAEAWAQKFQPGCDLRLSTIALTGTLPEIENYIENVY